MSLPDAAAGAQLASGSFALAWLAYLDFEGDPVRATTARAAITVDGSGDGELDGYTFDAVDPSMVSVGDVKNADGGSETLTFILSGIVGPDSDLLNVVGNTSLWQGRVARLWAIVYDEAGVQQGAIWPVYTGRMSALQIVGSPSEQTVKLDVENYLASLKQASGRTYLDQGSFDPLDNTAALTIGVANGSIKGVVTNHPGVKTYWNPDGVPLYGTPL
jgi:hypothetical protein